MAVLTFTFPSSPMKDARRTDDLLAALMRSTFTPGVVADRDGMGVGLALDDEVRLLRRHYRHPILLSACSGAGAKIDVAAQTGRYEALGLDLVARCVNELAARGAEGLIFSHYAALADAGPSARVDLVRGIAQACQQAGCALLKTGLADFGEVRHNALVGFAVGMAETERIPNPEWVCPGDSVIGLAADGLHCSGCAQAIDVFRKAQWRMDRTVEELAVPLGEVLSTPTKIYARSIERLLRTYRVKKVVHGIGHVSEGGIPESLRRMLPDHCRAEIDSKRWDSPPIFSVLKDVGKIEDAQMFRSFSMGLGMIVIVSPFYAQAAARRLKRFGETAFVIGHVTSGERSVAIA